ncbi:MAG: diguanylate cyclase (GGDEF)-like protein/PAS domain S-box-containing protein, partial [Oceanospirillaceae bacterium]
DIVYVSIFDEFGTEVYFSDRKISENTVIEALPLTIMRNNSVNHLGEIRIHATLDNIYDQLQNRVVLILIGQGIKTFLVSFFILLLIFQLISRRLNLISKFVQGIGESEDVKLWPKSNLYTAMKRGKSSPDELDELAQTIDLMSRKVTQLYTESEEQRHKLSQIFEGAHDAIIIVDFTTKNIVDFNSKTCELLSISKDQLLDHPLYSLYSIANNVDDLIEEVQRIGWCIREITFRSQENNLIPTETSASMIEIEDKHYLLATCRDIRERKQQEIQMDKLMHYDQLTGLPNRLLMRERISQALTKNEGQEHAFATMIINIDNFKTVNDALGQASGDLLIKMTAKIIQSLINTEDNLGRLSADEYLLLIERSNFKKDAMENIAQNIRAQFLQPLDIAGSSVKISVSIGCSIIEIDSAIEVEEVLRFTDLALCKAKADGRDRVVFYHTDMDHQANQKLQLNTELYHAFQTEEFELFYQPIIALESQKTVSVECLLRWRKSDGSLISPAHFIPPLVASGLIVEVGAWVIEKACTAMAQFKDSNVSIAINVSPCQLESDAIIVHIQKVLAKTGLAPQRLVIEITEDLVIQDQGWAIARLKTLRKMGVTVALDDFGTGYSSLAYLKMLPVNKLKIDQSFVRDMLGDPEDSAIVETIISIAKTLKLEIIAEGVETLAQAEHLRLLGCENVQGYYYQKPQPNLAKSVYLNSSA